MGDKRKMNIRVTQHQIEMIVNAMEKNPLLNGSKLQHNYTAAQRNADWEALSHKLNCFGGAIKNIKCWQKTWSDKKCEVKKRNRIYKNECLKTGGGILMAKPLTPLEERILSLIGLDAAEGLNVEESEEMCEVEDASRDNATLPDSEGSEECVLPTIDVCQITGTEDYSNIEQPILNTIPCDSKSARSTTFQMPENPTQADEFTHFGNNVACQLRSMPLEKALFCQVEILKLLSAHRVEQFTSSPTHPVVAPDSRDSSVVIPEMRRSSIVSSETPTPQPQSCDNEPPQSHSIFPSISQKIKVEQL